MIAHFYNSNGENAGMMGAPARRILNDVIPRGGYMLTGITQENEDGYTVLEYANAAGASVVLTYDTMTDWRSVCQPCHELMHGWLDVTVNKRYADNAQRYTRTIEQLRIVDNRERESFHNLVINGASECLICGENEKGKRHPVVFQS